VAELAARIQESGRPDHLRRFPLEFAQVPGLGPAETAGLARWGIRTAADVAPSGSWPSRTSTSTSSAAS